MMSPKTFLCAALLASLVACGERNGGGTTPAPDATGPKPATAPAPADHFGEAQGGLKFSGAEGWVTEQPGSSMRVAQFRLPKVEGDKDDAKVIVYYFGGGGGSVDDNIERWIGQFEQPDGKPSRDVAKIEQKTLSGMQAHQLDISGTYVAETAPGSGVRLREEGYRMLALVLESEFGPYYVRFFGPKKTVDKWEGSFRTFLEKNISK